jgi:hypothetical protein
MRPDEVMHASIHEAAHATLMCFCSGLGSVKYASIGHQEIETPGGFAIVNGDVCRNSEPVWVAVPNESNFRQYCLEMLAGLAADRRAGFDGLDEHYRHDYEAIAYAAACCGVSDARRDEIVESAATSLARLFNHEMIWTVVEELAASLRVHGRMEGAEIQKSVETVLQAIETLLEGEA